MEEIMRRSIPFSSVLLAFLAVGFAAAPANAQATRTWVSGVGNDANPCSRTAPCLTWAGAIAQTAAGGEIDALDPGGFGAVTITKAITLDGGGGQVASILAAGTNGITVAAGPNDVVIIRNMRINGLLGTATPGAYGIYFTSGAVLSVENCTIFGFGAAGGAGIYASTSGNSTLNVTNTNITNNLNGIYMTPGGNLYGSIDHTTIQKMSGFGIFAGNGGGSVIVTVTNSNILNAAVNGVFAYGAGAVLDIDTSSVTNNNTAFANNGGIIRISRNVIYDNNTNFSIAGGTIASSGDNYVAVNGATVPNASIAQQ
jgi:hypothetical protein